MYLYFNSKGVLEEVVNDIPTRKDSSNVNHIYVYIDGVAYDNDDKYYPLPDSIESLSTRYQLPDGTITPVALVNSKVQQSIPYDKHRDMKCFKDFYNYEFFDIELPSGVNEDGSQSEMPNVLGQSGLVALTIIEQPVGLALGLVVFNVEQEVGITTDTLVTEAQFNYLMGYIAKYDKQVSDIKTLIPDGTTEDNKLTNTTIVQSIVQNMIDANIPTFTTSTIWTKEFINKVAKVGYAIYTPNNTMYSVFNADDSEIELQLFNAGGLVSLYYIISVGQTILQATVSGHNLVETIDGRIPNVTSVEELHDAVNKAYVVEQISDVETEIESVGQYAQNTQQELNELKASLYGYVFGEDTANFEKLDISALPSMINNNNVAYNTRLMLDTIKGRSVKWTQLVDKSNLRDTTTINGVTFTINKNNGTITVNGTATEDITCGIYPDGDGLHVLCFPQDYVYLKGCPSGGSASTYYLRWANAGEVEDFGSGYYNKLSVFTDTNDVYCNPEIIIKSGTTMTNKIFRPQLFNVSDIYGLGKEPATIADFNKDYPYNIYPYGKQEILTTKVSGIKIRAGYKNLIKNALATISNATKNGVTFTVDKTNGTITANGTASADTTFYCGYVTYKITDFGINNTSIKTFVRGCPTGGSTSTYRLRNDWLGAFDIGIGNISTLSERNPNTTIYLSTTIMIASGTTCNNLVFKPQLIDLTNTYGAGNEPTVAQFNQDYPDIDNIPYPDTEITFDEQTLYGINDAQDTLQVVKEDNGYKLQKVENIGLYDLSNSTTYYKESDENHKFFAINVPNIKAATSTIIGNILFANYITDSQTHVYNNLYNLTIATAPSQNNGVIIYNKDKWESMTAEEFKNSLSGQTLYYALVTPVTTTLATLTKNQVTALFAKGYCVEILGNDDNRIIVRPDLSLNMVIKLIGGNTNE